MKVALLGVGRLGATHAATASALPEVTELRVYDADPERARIVAAPLASATVAATVDEALDGAEAAVIVTPTDTHAALIPRCLDAGIPTFCEKPIAIGLPETKKIVDHVAATGGRLQIGFQRRFDAGYQRARAAIRAGDLGTVYSFVMVSCDRTPPPDAYVASSGGQFKDQFIHDFDITRWLLDDEVDEITATGSTRGFPAYDAMKDVGTSAAMIRMRQGTIGLMTALRHNEAGYDIHVEIHGGKVTILGTGNAFADGGRSHACILVTAPEGRILLDCGGSSLPPLRRVCDPTEIDAVAITHLHGDHFGGLPFLAMQQKYAPRTRDLLIGGPPSLERRYKDAALALYTDFYDTPMPYEIRFTVLGPRPLRFGPAEVSAHPVEHVAVSEPHGLRVRIGGRLIAYSGDARWSAALPPLAEGADLFICETTTYSRPDPVHLSATELVAHRGELRCDRVIATHLGSESIAHLAEFGVEHAEDGMEIAL